MHKKLLNPAEAAEMIGISRTKVYELLAGGQIASVKIGARRLVPVEKIDEYIETLLRENEHEGSAA
jgi:excisionase family DNA binding protein